MISCRYNCTGLGLIASIILSVVAAFLTFAGRVAITAAFSWVALGIGVVGLVVLLIYTALLRRTAPRDCVCSILPTAIIGSLGTIVAALVSLGITIVAASITGAIISGGLILFLFLYLTSVACLTTCTAGCDGE